MSVLKKSGNFALFMNFIITILYILLTWDGSGNISFYIPDNLPFGRDRAYNINIFGLVITIGAIMLVIAGVLGVQVFGSGLQDSSVKNMIRIMNKMLLYILLTIFTYSVLAMAGEIGLIIYWILTFFFALGIIESSIQNNGDE